MKELIQIQSKIVCPKEREVKSHGTVMYTYRNAEDIFNAAKKLLADNGCHLTVGDELCDINGRIFVKATAIITNSAGEKVSNTAYAELSLRAGMNPAQDTGTASSYARKYALNGLFLLDDVKDPDTPEYNAEAEAAKQRAARQQTTQQATQQQQVQQPQEKEVFPGMTVDELYHELQLCTNRKEMMELWESYSEQQGNPVFVSMFTARKNQLGIRR